MLFLQAWVSGVEYTDKVKVNQAYTAKSLGICFATPRLLIISFRVTFPHARMLFTEANPAVLFDRLPELGRRSRNRDCLPKPIRNLYFLLKCA